MTSFLRGPNRACEFSVELGWVLPVCTPHPQAGEDPSNKRVQVAVQGYIPIDYGSIYRMDIYLDIQPDI